MKRQTFDSQWVDNSGESYRRKQGPTGRKSVLEIENDKYFCGSQSNSFEQVGVLHHFSFDTHPLAGLNVRRHIGNVTIVY